LRWPRHLESHTIRAFQRQDFARLRRRCDSEPEALKDRADDSDLFRIGAGKAFWPGPARIFEPDPDIAAHPGRLGGHAQPGRTSAQHGRFVLITKQAVRRTLHMGDILGMCADSAQYSEYGLNEEWRFHEAAVEAVFQIVEMADVIAFELEARAVRGAS